MQSRFNNPFLASMLPLALLDSRPPIKDQETNQVLKQPVNTSHPSYQPKPPKKKKKKRK